MSDQYEETAWEIYAAMETLGDVGHGYWIEAIAVGLRSAVAEKDVEIKRLREALEWIWFETGKRGANGDTKHRDRLIWETAREALAKDGGKP